MEMDTVVLAEVALVHWLIHIGSLGKDGSLALQVHNVWSIDIEVGFLMIYDMDIISHIDMDFTIRNVNLLFILVDIQQYIE